jgi:hypothetical protein
MDNSRPRMSERTELLPVLEKMKTLFDHCSNNHTKPGSFCHTRSDGAVPPIEINLIDCHNRRIVGAPLSTGYAALSYVCGELEPLPAGNKHELGYRSIHGKLAPVYEDAIDMTLFLGITYLWIDQYCAEQLDGEVKRRQLGQMGHIYHHASITTIAGTSVSVEFITIYL